MALDLAAARRPMVDPRLHRPALTIALALLLAAWGCASGGAANPDGPAGQAVVELAITNDHDGSVRIYLIDGPAAIPLGSVQSRERRTFRVDLARLRTSGALQLAADPVGPSPRVHLPPVEVGGGQVVDFNLTKDLRFATFRVRPVQTAPLIINRRSSVS